MATPSSLHHGAVVMTAQAKARKGVEKPSTATNRPLAQSCGLGHECWW
jgi:hypothetical protein